MSTPGKKYGDDVPAVDSLNSDDAELIAMGYKVCKAALSIELYSLSI